MKINKGKIVANGMLREGTPIQDYQTKYGFHVKREDLSCPWPGPPFSKARGVFAHLTKRTTDKVIGVLDTYHSQAGHAVARACSLLGKTCINYYPEYKYEPGPRKPQIMAKELGAVLVPLQAGRSAILFHQAKKDCESRQGYMMPNALKLDESVTQTAKEVPQTKFDLVIIPVSSATIAAGVILGFEQHRNPPRYILHLGYSRSKEQVLRYVESKTGLDASNRIRIVDENYAYRDTAKKGKSPPWSCNPYYDLKAFRWWLRNRGRYKRYKKVLFWNIG